MVKKKPVYKPGRITSVHVILVNYPYEGYGEPLGAFSTNRRAVTARANYLKKHPGEDKNDQSVDIIPVRLDRPIV